jgi:hypothetical protein
MNAMNQKSLKICRGQGDEIIEKTRNTENE